MHNYAYNLNSYFIFEGNEAQLDKNWLTSKPSKQFSLYSQIYSKWRYLHEMFQIANFLFNISVRFCYLSRNGQSDKLISY